VLAWRFEIQNILNLDNGWRDVMTAAQMAFIDDMGQLMVGWGIARNTGRIYAYLLLQRDPASLDDMVEALEIAKSGASIASRQLVQIGLTRAVGEPGSRRVRYEALSTIESIVTARNKPLQDLLVRLRQGVRAMPAGPSRQRLQSMADICEMFAEEMPLLARRLERRRA
jgi:DNA-binding transcriptional regulator GbsR (MarR family)